MTGEEDERLVSCCGESSGAAEVLDLKSRDMDSLVVGAGEELDDEEVGTLEVSVIVCDCNS